MDHNRIYLGLELLYVRIGEKKIGINYFIGLLAKIKCT